MTTISSTSGTTSNTSTTSTAKNYSRVSGLASGLDTDSIVSSLMKAERAPLDKLEQQKQTLEWQQEDYRSLNSILYDFKTNAFDTRLESTFNVRTASSSNVNVAAATAGTTAVDGTYTITVNSLASGVSKGSTAKLAEETDADGKTLTLFNQFSEFTSRGISSTDTISVTINGTKLDFDLDQDNINTVVSKINSADLGVKASYDNNLNRFFLTSTGTGSDSKVVISSDSAGFLSNGTNDSILKLNVDEGTSYNGQNASVSLGDAANLEFATNTVTVNGITLNLKSKGDTSIQVSRDVDGIVNSITSLVDSYNKTIAALYAKADEKRNSDYAPLTDSQKAEMTDSQITAWNLKAHSGLLRNDIQLSTIISNLRSTMSSIISNTDGQYNSLSQIGITTKSYLDNGKLYIDKTALTEAVSKDPEAVKKMFTNSSTVSDENGFANKLYTATVNAVTYLSNKAGSDTSLSTVDNSYIGNRLTELNTKIKAWETKLTDIEDRYYTRFTIMETYINRMNTQSSWLASQFGSSSSS
jgi:flagellar hook-associated protein 2